MNKWIGPKAKQVWNSAMHVLHNVKGVVINTTAYHLGSYNLHLLLESSMVRIIFKILPMRKTRSLHHLGILN